MPDDRNRVCPVELADSLDSRLRRWIQNPHRILAPFVREGMTALDVGCGPGFFSMELARCVGPGGSVIAADLQEGMLKKLADKVKGGDLEKRIQLVKCEQNNINVSTPVDFILAFYVVHEIPDKAGFFRQVKSILKPDGTCLIVEPKLFHVSRKGFQDTLELAGRTGLKASAGPALLLSWSAILRTN